MPYSVREGDVLSEQQERTRRQQQCAFQAGQSSEHSAHRIGTHASSSKPFFLFSPR